MRNRLFFILLAIPLIGQANIYTWIDANGVTHYSDAPMPQAKIMHLTPQQFSQPISFPAAFANKATVLSKTQNSAANLKTSKQKASQLFSGYTEIRITQPVKQATVYNNQGDVEVQVILQPALQTEAGDKLVYWLDNQSFSVSTTATTKKLINVNRGEHKLQAQVQNRNNQVLLTSDEIIFYMQRPKLAK